MNSLEEYGAIFEKLGLTELEVQDGDFKLKLRKEVAACGDRSFLTKNFEGLEGGSQSSRYGNGFESNNTSHNFTDSVNSALSNEPQKEIERGEAIKSPLLGIFYELSGDKKAIKEGDSVREGDVLCTIEAMKMMNEVKATKSGIIKKICAKDGDLVEYNQELFIVA